MSFAAILPWIFVGTGIAESVGNYLLGMEQMKEQRRATRMAEEKWGMEKEIIQEDLDRLRARRDLFSNISSMFASRLSSRSMKETRSLKPKSPMGSLYSGQSGSNQQGAGRPSMSSLYSGQSGSNQQQATKSPVRGLLMRG